MSKKIKVLVVDDSKFFRAAIIMGLSRASDIEVVGEAYDPYEARNLILDFDPDVITLDLQMPYMNGLEFLKILLPQWKVPVIIVSSHSQSSQDALLAGASAFLQKPHAPDELSRLTTELIKQIRSLAGKRTDTTDIISPVAPGPNISNFKGVIAIGASAGGTQTTAAILKALPANFPGIVIVQHMPQEFTKSYADNLNKDCAMSVREAEDGDEVRRGLCLIAPGGDRHCEVIKRDRVYCVRLKQGAKVSGHCPSVDVLFESVAKCAPGTEAVGIILTGMGSDGAIGLLKMKQTGSFTIGQDQKTSVVYGMPKVAFDTGAVVRQASLENIPHMLQKYLEGYKGGDSPH